MTDAETLLAASKRIASGQGVIPPHIMLRLILRMSVPEKISFTNCMDAGRETGGSKGAIEAASKWFWEHQPDTVCAALSVQ